MKGITCLIAVFCVASAFSAKAPARAGNCNCGWVNKGRIVGGVEAKKNRYPLVVALLDAKGQFCGGTILTEWHVVTAAHCTQRRKAEQIKVNVGVHNWKKREGVVHNIARIIEHEQYNVGVPVANDIALLVTQTPIKFNQNVGPACMPTAKLPLTGVTVKALGWGLTSNMGKPSDVLREVDLRVASPAECNKHWSVNPQTQLCSYEVRKDTCQQDSGGPLIWLNPATNRYTLAALVSYGGECAGPRPGVYTDVGGQAAWINKKIAESKPGVAVCSRG